MNGTPAAAPLATVPVAVYFSNQICRLYVPHPAIVPLTGAQEVNAGPSLKDKVVKAPVGTALQCVFLRSVLESLDQTQLYWVLCRDTDSGFQRFEVFDFNAGNTSDLVRSHVRLLRWLIVALVEDMCGASPTCVEGMLSILWLYFIVFWIFIFADLRRRTGPSCVRKVSCAFASAWERRCCGRRL